MFKSITDNMHFLTGNPYCYKFNFFKCTTLNTINSYNEVVKANRAELMPQSVEKLLKEADYDDRAEESINLDLVQ